MRNSGTLNSDRYPSFMLLHILWKSLHSSSKFDFDTSIKASKLRPQLQLTLGIIGLRMDQEKKGENGRHEYRRN
ncbi:hypothetical protein Ahy_A02g006981 isoform D [Arachis hypogaea]|uniref:Uncharacterized protein n=1 Tax=Arachis hypogaea TaxID=3818 RepID=A0A445EBT4_ARAHY|nr:hypothetical protein Ahy_A02g006981 isoform D [Arachis hypogaea]